MTTRIAADWGCASEAFDELKKFVGSRDLVDINEAQTRFDVIDRMIREVLGWTHGHIDVEEYAPTDEKAGFVDYILRMGDSSVVIEAKRLGAAFPNPTDKPKLKLSGSVLGAGEVATAITQAHSYAETKGADVVVITNGLCWCFFANESVLGESYASLLFPFAKPDHAERLYNLFAAPNVAAGSLTGVTNVLPLVEERLLSAFRMTDNRVDRNNIADQIAPALTKALYAEALLKDADALRRCFVSTEARTKFDAVLGMHLSDPKPTQVRPAKRINREKKNDHLSKIVESSQPGFAPPVTLVIGPVGAGKSTYLKHFELVSGAETLEKKDAHWIYIDMEALGQSGNPRAFMYAALREYLANGMRGGPADFEKLLRPAYAKEIEALRRGPLALLANDTQAFNLEITKLIKADYDAIEPYVDKVIGHLAREKLAVIILDNIDLYEDDRLETLVFSEGLALSKRVFCNVIVCIRDTTFVRHKNDSAFDAYELRKLWLDPPPLKAVISARLSYSKKILQRKQAFFDLPNGMRFHVPDLSVFFDIVQQSILRGQAGDYVEAIADLDTRRGLTLVNNFLTSGHIEADRALKEYLSGNQTYYFPFHEIFKGSMLGQWLHFNEGRVEGLNIFDSRLGSRRLRLLRCFLLQFLLNRAKTQDSMEVPFTDCVATIGPIGATEAQIESALTTMQKYGLIRTIGAEAVGADSTLVASRAGGYYVRMLAREFVYVEECMWDTAIESDESWRLLSDYTATIEHDRIPYSRMLERKKRIAAFLEYLQGIEDEVLLDRPALRSYATISTIRDAVLRDVDGALRKLEFRKQVTSRSLGPH